MRVMRWAIWWFAVLVAYALATEAKVGGEYVAGAVVAVLAVLPVLLAVKYADVRFRVPLRWVGRLAGVPMKMLSDAFIVTIRIVAALARGERLTGFIMRVPFENGSREPSEVGREALAVYGISCGPNSVVAEAEDPGELVLHHLVRTPERRESARWPL